MTSRQPGVTPPGKGGQRGEGASLESALTAQDWLMRLLPLVLLIVAGLAGLRGAAGTPRWDGPLHQDALVVGVALEVVILILFVILLVRRTRGSQEATAVKLRGVLMTVLGAGALGAVVLALFSLNLHVTGQGRTPLPQTEGGGAGTAPRTGSDTWPLVRKFFDYLEANAEEYGQVPLLEAPARRTSRPRRGPCRLSSAEAPLTPSSRSFPPP